jgi:hypothetical protein
VSNLALDLRPTSLSEILGQDAAKRAIESFAKKDNWPNVFLFYGPPGCGKTTLAQIVAKMAGADESCTHEINASGENGVDSARELAEMSGSQPFTGKRRVIILNEFHQFTGPAQEVLKDPMEKNPAIWILTTDRPDKISPAIRSRASAATFEVKLLSGPQICALLSRAAKDSISSEEGKKVVEFLWERDIKAPREILGVLDQHLAGIPLEQCVHGSEHEPLYPEIATAVLSGNWTKTSSLLKQVPTADYRAMVAVVSAKMSWALLDSDFGPRADAIATCLVGLGVNQFADGVAYSSLKALLYKCTRTLSKETK